MIELNNGEKLGIGSTISKTEKNGYHDSDFYATYWNGEKIVSIQYDTTRFGGYGSAFVDATDEVLELAKNYETARLQKIQDRLDANAVKNTKLIKKLFKGTKAKTDRIMDFVNNKEMWRTIAHGDCGVSISWNDLESETPYKTTDRNLAGRLLRMLFETNLRSDFKMSMKEQALKWFRSNEPKHNTPLSPKQLQYI